MAEKFDFKILADECYSEIYREKQPSGALENLHEFNANPERLVIFNSLSKRSNLPGLRSGFAAGGKNTIAELKKLKAYCGAPCPTPLQHAAAAAWNDEAHVEYNRKQYSRKLEIADKLFQNLPDYYSPKAGFFLWLPVDNDEKTTIDLWEKFGVKVLHGSYLSQENHISFNSQNPGIGYIRIALVRSEDEIKYGLSKIADYLMH